MLRCIAVLEKYEQTIATYYPQNASLHQRTNATICDGASPNHCFQRLQIGFEKVLNVLQNA